MRPPMHQCVIAKAGTGNLIIHRLGDGFHVLIDDKDGVRDMPISWVDAHRAQLHEISRRISMVVITHGQDRDASRLTYAEMAQAQAEGKGDFFGH